MCIAIMHIRIYTYDNKHVMKYCDVRTNVMYVLINHWHCDDLMYIYIYNLHAHFQKN